MLENIAEEIIPGPSEEADKVVRLHKVHGKTKHKPDYKPQADQPQIDPLWIKGCIKSDTGTPVSVLANAMDGLRKDPGLHDIVAYDEMLRAPILMHTLEPKPGFKPRPVTDSDVSQIQEFFQRKGLVRVTKDMTHQAVDFRAEERSFHPVRDYLNTIEWDGTPRLDTFLSKYFGAEESDYTSQIGTM